MNASAQSLHLLESVYQGALRFITGSNHHCTLYSLAGPHWPYEWWFIGITPSINPFLAYCPIIYQSTCHFVPKLSQSQDCQKSWPWGHGHWDLNLSKRTPYHAIWYHTPTVSIWSSYATWFCVRLAIYPGLTLPCPVIAGPGKAEENWWMDGWRDGNHFSLRLSYSQTWWPCRPAGCPAGWYPISLLQPRGNKKWTSKYHKHHSTSSAAFKLSFTGYRNSREDLIWLKYSA